MRIADFYRTLNRNKIGYYTIFVGKHLITSWLIKFSLDSKNNIQFSSGIINSIPTQYELIIQQVKLCICLFVCSLSKTIIIVTDASVGTFGIGCGAVRRKKRSVRSYRKNEISITRMGNRERYFIQDIYLPEKMVGYSLGKYIYSLEENV